MFLVGFMGAGKTCVGEALAARLGWSFFDLDQRIEASQKQTIAAIFRQSGEDEFRRLENEELGRLLNELDGAAVVALGGGTFVHPPNAASLLTCGYTVFLDAPVEQLWQRAQLAQGARPLALSENHFRQLYAARRARYMEADCCVQTGDKTVAEVVSEITARLPWGTSKGESG